MEAIFESVLRAGLSGSVIIAVILGLRLILRNTPRRMICLLWLLAILRLLVPFSIESPMSLQPDTDQVAAPRQGIVIVPEQDVSGTPSTSVTALVPHDTVINTGTLLIDGQVFDQVEYYYDWTVLIPGIWAAVAGGFLLYTAVSYLLLKRKVRNAVQLDRNIFECGEIDTAFLLGYFRPKIYLPTGLPPRDMEHILAHEQMHLRRFDNWTKLLGFLALSVHWFNPLVWAAYALLCRDIEMACDEDVILTMEVSHRKEYSSALLRCAAGHRMISACPVAFGEVSVKQRIPRILNYRKPAFWISLAAIVAVVFVAVCFLTDPAPTDPVQRCIQALQEKASAEEFYLHTYPTHFLTEESRDTASHVYMRANNDFLLQADYTDGTLVTVTEVDGTQQRREQTIMNGDIIVSDTYPQTVAPEDRTEFALPWPFTADWDQLSPELDHTEITEDGYELISLLLPEQNTTVMFYFLEDDLIYFWELNESGGIRYSFIDYYSSDPIPHYIRLLHNNYGESGQSPHDLSMQEKCRQALLDFQSSASYSAMETFTTNDPDVLNQETTLHVWVSGEDWLRIHAPTVVDSYYLQKDGRQFIKYVTAAVAPGDLAYPDWTETDLSDTIPGVPELWLNRFQWDDAIIHYREDSAVDGCLCVTLAVINDQSALGYDTMEFRFDANGALTSVRYEITWYNEAGQYCHGARVIQIYDHSPETIAGYIDTHYREATAN